jgi:hypothetical protein
MPRVRREGTQPDDFLPLPRDTFDVLVSLADRDRHGYAILQDAAERRRYSRLTPFGRRVAESEAARLTRLLADARASGLVPRRR